MTFTMWRAQSARQCVRGAPATEAVAAGKSLLRIDELSRKATAR